jgi:hypothetical protein
MKCVYWKVQNHIRQKSFNFALTGSHNLGAKMTGLKPHSENSYEVFCQFRIFLNSWAKLLAHQSMGENLEAGA